MPITAERLEVDVQADTSGARRELDSFSRATGQSGKYADQAGGKASGMGRKFGAAAALVKAAAGTMVASIAGKTIMAASDLNEVVSKTGVVFGPQAKIVTDAAQEMADKFGISKATFLDAASGIGLVGKASGLTQKAAANLSSDFAKLAADASSFYNVPIEDALAAMKSGLVGESEPMRQFGVLLSENAVKTEAYRLGLAKTGEELTEQQKVQARASLIQKGMADSSGDLARTQESVANRLREIRGRLTNFAADMGTKALPAVEKFLGAVIKAPGKIKAVYDAIRGWVDQNQTLATVLGMVAAAVTVFWTVGKAVAIVKGISAAIKAWTVAQWALNTALFANPIVLVVAAIAALVAAAFIAYKRFEGFRNVVNAVGNALKVGFLAAVNFAKQAWQTLAPIVMAGVNAIKAAVMGYVRFMLPIWKAMWTAVKGVAKAVWNAIKGVVQAGLKIIQGIVNVVMGAIRGDWGRVWKGIQQIVGGVWDYIKALVSGAIGVVKAVISGGVGVIKAVWTQGWNAMKALLSAVWNGIKAGVQNGISAVMGFVRGLPGQITGVFSGAGSLLLGAGKAIIQGLLDGIGSMIGSVKSKLGELTSMIPDLKGPYEKDLKLLRKNGRAIIKGLVKGFDQEFPRVKKYLGGLTKWVRDSFGGNLEKNLVRRIKNSQKRARQVLEREAKITERLQAQIARRNDLREQKSGFIDSMRQGISAQANVLNAGNNASTIRSSLEAQVAKAKEFAANLKAMAGMGYPRDLIAQVAGAGIEGGAEVAKALAAAHGGDVKGIRQAFNQINSIAQSQAQSLGNMLYNPGIQAANGLIEGLKRKRKDVEAVLVQIAKGMSKALRKALGIKSPSRVMQRLMAYVGAGLVRGLDATRKGVAKAASRMGTTVSGGIAGGIGSGPTFPGRPGGPGGPLTPASTGGTGTGGDVHFHFATYNPKDEPQSRTTNKALDRVTSLGLV